MKEFMTIGRSDPWIENLHFFTDLTVAQNIFGLKTFNLLYVELQVNKSCVVIVYLLVGVVYLTNVAN